MNVLRPKKRNITESLYSQTIAPYFMGLEINLHVFSAITMRKNKIELVGDFDKSSSPDLTCHLTSILISQEGMYC